MCSCHVEGEIFFFVKRSHVDKIDEEGRYLYKDLVVSSLMTDLSSFCMCVGGSMRLLMRKRLTN